MLPRVKKAQPRQDYTVEILFQNGETKVFDVKPYLQYPVYQPLNNLDLFTKCIVFNGTIVWEADYEIDLDPDTLYLESKPAA